MRRGTATLLIASMFVSYTALFAWRANLDLSNHLFLGVVSLTFRFTEPESEPDYQHNRLSWRNTLACLVSLP